MYRAIVVFALITFGAAYSLKGPFHTLLFYLWIAYFRPVHWYWEGINLFPAISFYTSAFLVAYTLITRQRYWIGTGVVLMILFLGQTGISTMYSFTPDWSWMLWRPFAQHLAISYLMIILLNDERRFRMALLVITLSLGLEEGKQGWYGLVDNPGGQNFNDLPSLGDNNHIAVAMLMLVPLLMALAATSTGKFMRHLNRFVAVGVLYRGITTYSRGGFLACGALGLHYFVRSKRKVSVAAGTVALAAFIGAFLPSAFWDRMSTIKAAPGSLSVPVDVVDDSVDSSMRSRLHFWRVAFLMAQDRPLTGIGHGAFQQVFDRYDFADGEFGRRRHVHSMWLGALAELGYPGLILFVIALIYALKSCRRVRMLAKTDPTLENLGRYAVALEGGFIVVLVGGSFITFHYAEIVWHWFALTVALQRITEERAAALQPAAIAPAMQLRPAFAFSAPGHNSFTFTRR